TVNLLAGEVFDTDVPTPQSALAATLGTFNVAVPNTYTVNEISDADNGVGNLSLREAIKAANLDGTPSRIVFDPTVFASAATITMGGTALAISQSVTIEGPVAGLTLDADDKSQVMNIDLAVLGQAVTMSRLRLINGKSGFYGGAIQNINAAL